MRHARYLSPAEFELAEAVRHYSEKPAKLANEFLNEVERAIESLVAFPESSPVIEDPLRRKVLRKFPYSLLSMLEREEITVVAVMSHSREPRSWVDRR